MLAAFTKAREIIEKWLPDHQTSFPPVVINISDGMPSDDSDILPMIEQGSFGDLSTCSFFPAHHMTMGEGGFVATSSGKIRKVLSSLRDWGRAC